MYDFVTPHKFRGKLGEVVTALKWRSWNHYHMLLFLDQECYQFAANGDLYLMTDEGSLAVHSQDWVVLSANGKYAPCSASMFEQLYPEEIP